MKIEEIKQCRVAPFETADRKLLNLFSFFLHLAPTIESEKALNIEKSRLENNWDRFIESIPINQYIFIDDHRSLETYLVKYSLSDECEINRKYKGLVVKRKSKKETEYECILRHIRNAIAHSNVYIYQTGNRKYICFTDFNKTGKQSAMILLSQTDLSNLKKELMK